MILTYILFAAGIFLLIKSSDWIIDSSSSLAKRLHVSNIIIGLTVVAFGTSLPELIIAIFASISNSPEVIFGNIIGSNIANILLILGITIIITNVKVRSETVWREIPFALLSSFVLFAITSKIFFSEEKTLLYSDGMILISLFLMFLYYIYKGAKNDSRRIPPVEEIEKLSPIIYVKLVLGLIGIYFAGKWVVDGAVFTALQLGLSEFLISATIISIGTTLPEMVVSIMSARKKNVDLAVGNAIGSCIFNTLWIIGVVSFINKIAIPPLIFIDIAIMFSAILILFIFMFIGKKQELTRKDGITFVLFYIIYILFTISRG